MSSRLPDPWPKVLPWVAAGALLFGVAAVTGFGAAYLVNTANAVPTVDPSHLPTPTPRPTPTPGPSTAVPSTPASPSASRSAAPPTTLPPGPTPSESATAGPSPTPIRYVVKRGETLSEIATQFGVSVDAIVELNHLENPNRIEAGQVLLIPVP
jgi:LysM repeat protein